MVTNKSNSKRTILSGFITSNKALLFGAFIALIISNFLNVLLPLSIGWFYEIVLQDEGPKSRLLKLVPLDLNLNTAQQFLYVFVALILFKTLFFFLEKFLSGIAGERFSRDMRELTFSSQLRHSLTAHRMRPVGKYLLRYSGDLLAIQNLMIKGVLGFAGDIFFIILAFAVLLNLNIAMGISVIVIFLISGFIIFLIGKPLRQAAWNRRSQRSQNLGFVSSRMHAFYTIKSFNRETPEENSYIKRSGKLYRFGVNYMFISAIVQALLPMFFFGTLLFIFYQITTTSQIISKGDIFVFVLLLLYMQTVMKRLLRVNLVWQVGLISFNKLVTLIQLPGEKREETLLPKNSSGSLSVENISFAYAQDKNVFSDLSFSLLPNSITFLKGKQGSGKSTIIKLLQKLYEPQSGKILMDKTDYSLMSAFEIRKNITVVSNEAMLLGGNVFKAISYSTSDDKKEKAIDILKQLNIQLAGNAEETLLFKLEDGGKNISGGERIMLQVARALLTRKKIILMDEPFAHLDAEARKTLVTKLNELRKKRTILLIAENIPPEIEVDQFINLSK